jgi:hypothetical protein
VRLREQLVNVSDQTCGSMACRGPHDSIVDHGVAVSKNVPQPDDAVKVRDRLGRLRIRPPKVPERLPHS